MSRGGANPVGRAPLSFPRGGKLSELVRTDEGLGSFLTSALLNYNARLTPHSSALRASTFPPTGEGFQDNNFSPSPRAQRALELPPGRRQSEQTPKGAFSRDEPNVIGTTFGTIHGMM